MDYILQALINGLLVGGIYACVAVGLSLSYGVMRIFNWANGEILMTASYLAVFLVNLLGLNPYLTIVVTGPVMFCFGYLLQKLAINPILMREKDREPLSVLLFTAGIAFILSNLATFLFTTNAISAKTSLQGATFKLGTLIIGTPRLYAFLIALTVVVVLQLFLQLTETGRALRCASQDREVAQLMGMNHRQLYSLALGIGFACVGVAASVMAPLYPVSPALGSIFSFKSMVVVVLGGKGSVPGALLGGLTVGVVEAFGGVVFSDVYAQMIIFIIFVAVLMFKPNGLLSKDRG